MSTFRERLDENKAKIRKAPGNDVALRPLEAEAQIDCAIETIDAMTGLKASVDDMANRTVTVINGLTEAIGKATAQAEESAKESGKVVTESAKLSSQLNSLTRWIVVAALLSSLAAVIQAGAAIYNSLHQPPIEVRVVSPAQAAPTAPTK
jgi:hypothetical protein